MIRFFDFILALLGFLTLSPLFLILSIVILLTDGSPVFFRQERIGLHGKPFELLKFRSMRLNSEKSGMLTVGEKDPRVTPIGHVLRRYKLDELPQLINVISGDMALVGPRPEVKKYVELYTEEQRKVLEVRPGITDLASIEYINENEVLGKSTDPEKTYVEEIMPHKIEINLRYVEKRNLITNIQVILKTLLKIIS